MRARPYRFEQDYDSLQRVYELINGSDSECPDTAISIWGDPGEIEVRTSDGSIMVLRVKEMKYL